MIQKNFDWNEMKIPIFSAARNKVEKIELSTEEWRKLLDPKAFRAARRGGAQSPFTGTMTPMMKLHMLAAPTSLQKPSSIQVQFLG